MTPRLHDPSHETPRYSEDLVSPKNQARRPSFASEGKMHEQYHKEEQKEDSEEEQDEEEQKGAVEYDVDSEYHSEQHHEEGKEEPGFGDNDQQDLA